MHLFYAPEVEKNRIVLSNEESKHLVKVLRLNIGDQVAAIDGKGNHYDCTVELAHQKSAVLKIDQTIAKNEVFGIEIAAAPTKNLSRWEWFLEKTTEIGIDAIHPIISYHSERKIVKQERQERILVSAVKQSYKATMPQLSAQQTFSNFIEQAFEGDKYIAHCYEDIPRKSLKTVHKKDSKALILIGPEGDFSRQEVEEAMSKGFVSVSLSESRLRTETAALVACHTIHLINA